MPRIVALLFLLIHLSANDRCTAEKPLKVFILAVGKLFAKAFLQSDLRIGGHAPQQILAMLGAKGRDAVADHQLATYLLPRCRPTGR